MKKNFALVSLEAGTLRANVRRAIASRAPLPPLSQQQIHTISEGIVKKIHDTMKFMSHCRRWMHWIIELFIADASTTPAERRQLMDWSSAQAIVYGIGRYLEMTRRQITASTQWPLARKIVLQALDCLSPGQDAPALLSNRPLNSGQIFNILVRSVFQEYTGFFLRGEEALKEKVMLSRGEQMHTLTIDSLLTVLHCRLLAC